MSAVRAPGAGKRPQFPTNQKSSISRIAPPKELSGDAAIKLWKSQSKELIDRGMFEPSDAPILLAYCNTFQLMLDAEQMLKAEGMADISSTGSKRKHPAAAVRSECVSQLARLSGLLGLDPLSRLRMTSGGGTNPNDDDGDDFSEFS